MKDGLYTAHEVAVIISDLFGMIVLAILTALTNGSRSSVNCLMLALILAEWLAGSSI